MWELFRMDSTVNFIAYSSAHLITLVILILLAILLFAFRVTLHTHVAGNVIRWLLIAVLALSEISLNVWYIGQGRYDIQDTLPLELCSISLYLCIAMLIWRSKRLLQIVYFTGIGGALQALLTPVLDYGFPHFRFLEFFIAHIAIILAVLYMVWVERQRVQLRSVWIAMGFMNFLLLTVGTANWLTGGNYMFLARKPDTASLLDLLGPYPWYLLALEAVALLLFLLLYFPFVIADRLRQRRVGIRAQDSERSSPS